MKQGELRHNKAIFHVTKDEHCRHSSVWCFLCSNYEYSY